MESLAPANQRKRRLADMGASVLIRHQPRTKQRRIPHIDIISFLSKIQDQRHVTAVARTKSLPFKIKHEHSVHVQALIVFLRFGSLSSDSCQWHTAAEVFRKTGIKAGS